MFLDTRSNFLQLVTPMPDATWCFESSLSRAFQISDKAIVKSRTLRFLRVAAGVFFLEILAGCMPKFSPYQAPLTKGTKPSSEHCAALAEHFISINSRGDFTAIDFKGCEGSSVLSRTLDKKSHIPLWTIRITEAIKNARDEDTTPLNILLFIHGGLNEPEDTLVERGTITRFAEDIAEIECKKADLNPNYKAECILNNGKRRYYPIFVIWPSGLADTYSDSIFNYYQGEWGNWKPALSTPLRIGLDLTEIAARAPQSYFHQLVLAFDSQFLAETLTSKIFSSVDQYDLCNRAPGFLCEKGDEDASNFLGRQTRDSYYRILSPAKLITTPAADPIGHRAWQNMIARSQFVFGTPCGKKLGYWPATQEDCHEGALATFFRHIDTEISTALRAIPITLIGHSMGAIVASDIVRKFPDLNYQEIIFMGAAVSIRKYLDSVEPLPKRRLEEEQQTNALRNNLTRESRNIGQAVSALADAVSAVKPSAARQQLSDAASRLDTVLRSIPERRRIEFYNLSLHPFAEATETLAFDPLPAGSLLEWIDNNFTDPVDLTDRTLGKWANVAAVQPNFDQQLLRQGVTHFKRFDLSCESPVKHGQFAQLSESGPCARRHYWQPAYWRELRTRKPP